MSSAQVSSGSRTGVIDGGSECSYLSVSVDQATVHVAGALDEATIGLVLGIAGALLDRGERDVTIDLQGASRIDSTAVRALLEAQRDSPPGIILRLVAPPWLRPRN